MALVAVTYLKGRAGATTTATGVAVGAPAEARAVLVECDPSGGDLMRRHRLAARPGVVDLAAAARGSAAGTGEVFTAGVQRLHIGDRVVPVVVAPAGGAQTRAALPELTRAGRAALNPPDRLVVADCGRLDVGSPARPVAAMADVVLVLVGADAGAVAHLCEHLADLTEVVRGRLVVLLAHGGVYPAAEVDEVLTRYVVAELAREPGSLTVTGPLPTDRRAAGLLGGALVPGRRWRRLPLLVALRRLAGELAASPLTAPDSGVRAMWEAGR